MRILLDESLPSELGDELAAHDVLTVQQVGWSGITNGALLARCADRFDVFVTADQNLRYQQNLRTLPVAVVVLVAYSNRMADLQPLMPELRARLIDLRPRTLIEIGSLF